MRWRTRSEVDIPQSFQVQDPEDRHWKPEDREDGLKFLWLYLPYDVMTYHDEPHHAMIYLIYHAVQMNWLYGFAFQGARNVGKHHGYAVHGSAFTLSPSFSVVSQVRQGRSPAEAGVSRWSEMAPVSLVVQPAASNPFIQLPTHQSIIEYLVLLLSTSINMYQYPIPSNSIQFHPIPSNSIQFHPIPSNSIQFHPIPSNSIHLRFHDIPCLARRS